LKPGDEILTTTLEHGGGEVGLEYLDKTRGAIVRKVELPLPPRSADEIVSAVEKALTPATRLVMLSHVNTVTGVLMPLAAISRITSSRGIYLLIDGAQAPGLTPVDVKAIGADAYASSGHKWLLGPKETGFLYVRNGFPAPVAPVFALYGFEAYTQSSGTRNVALHIGLGAAIDFHSRLDINKTAAYAVDLRNYCLEGLRQVKGIRVISPEDPALYTGILSFELLNKKNSDVFSSLRDRNIIVKVLPQHNAIRISCHVFVSRADIDQFLAELGRLV
jgi:selenocysteine lyase/cysteine desulfurase